MGTSSSFSAMFSRRDSFRDFLFAYMEDKVFPKLNLLLQERICLDERKLFRLWDMGNKEHDKVICIPITTLSHAMLHDVK